MDLVAGAGLFGRAWPRLCAGYGAGAAIGQKPASHLTGRQDSLIEALSSCAVEMARAAGLGTEYRLTGARMAGAALVADDRVAHLMAFPIAGTT